MRLILRFSLIIFVLIILDAETNAEILMQDNFDNTIPSDWNSSRSIFSPWSMKGADAIYTIGGITKHASTIESPGRGGSGKSYRINRCNGFRDGYIGQIAFDIPGEKRKIYQRMYLKFPKGWNFHTSAEAKWDRWYIISDSGNAPSDEIRVSWMGGEAADSELKLYWVLNDFFSPKIEGWSSFPKRVYLGDYLDSKWHCWEFMIFVESNRVTVELWIDGNSKGPISRATNMTNSSARIRRALHPGVGNLTNGEGWTRFPENKWYSIEVDDYAVSTTYIGPGGISSSGISSNSSTSSSSTSTSSSSPPPPPGRPRVID